MIHEFKIPEYYTFLINDETGDVECYSSSKHAKGKKLSISPNKDGYLKIKLYKKTHFIHSIVAEKFLGKRPKGLCVNHKDGDKRNNRPDNLEYVTISENIKHSIKHGMHICNRPELLPRYIDGRCKDIVAYKKSWYESNKERILLKAKERYHVKKQIAK